jgi:hypothetical protein
MCYYLSEAMIPESPAFEIINTELNNFKTKKFCIKPDPKPFSRIQNPTI